ncbi:MAG: winged helix-turn-helix transcriptional regulator, partial [Pseudomonadota bacterium]|nr:winged helix-turn-helix transcriptional regulator [Pseudomonadota bacterium]
LMLQYGYSYMPYASMESVVEASKEGYYRALRGTQKSIWTDKADYEPWLSFFITSLQKQKRLLEEKIKLVQNQEAEKLSGTAQNILELFAEQPEWTVTNIADKLDKNIETVKKSVQSLIKKGYLIKHGTTKAVYYTLNK